MKIERRDLANLSPKFAVKLGDIFKLLKINELQNGRKSGDFVKIFHNFSPPGYPPDGGRFFRVGREEKFAGFKVFAYLYTPNNETSKANHEKNLHHPCLLHAGAGRPVVQQRRSAGHHPGRRHHGRGAGAPPEPAHRRRPDAARAADTRGETCRRHLQLRRMFQPREGGDRTGRRGHRQLRGDAGRTAVQGLSAVQRPRRLSEGVRRGRLRHHADGQQPLPGQLPAGTGAHHCRDGLAPCAAPGHLRQHSATATALSVLARTKRHSRGTAQLHLRHQRAEGEGTQRGELHGHAANSRRHSEGAADEPRRHRGHSPLGH